MTVELPLLLPKEMSVCVCSKDLLDCAKCPAQSAKCSVAENACEKRMQESRDCVESKCERGSETVKCLSKLELDTFGGQHTVLC